MELVNVFKEVANTDLSYIIYNFNMYLLNYNLMKEFQAIDGDKLILKRSGNR